MVKLPDYYPFPLHLSSVGDPKNRLRPLVKFQPVRLVIFRPAPTVKNGSTLFFVHGYVPESFSHREDKTFK